MPSVIRTEPMPRFQGRVRLITESHCGPRRTHLASNPGANTPKPRLGQRADLAVIVGVKPL
jgi:hypothetical protein